MPDDREQAGPHGSLGARLTQPSAQRGKLVLALFAVTMLAAIGVGLAYGLAFSLLIVAGFALFLIVALLWSSVQSLAGETPLTLDEALSLGAPSAEEEQKRAVLRALKDLEYERSVGKIDEDDYRELSTRYREEARRLITALDETSAPARALAEKLAAERVARAGAGVGATSAEAETEAAHTAPDSSEPEPSKARPTAKAKPKIENGSSEPHPEPTARADTVPESAETPSCAECGTPNDADALFCKRCGASLRTAAAAEEKTS